MLWQCIIISSVYYYQLRIWLVFCLPLAFHIFDISSKTITQIGLILCVRHQENMEIQIAKFISFRYLSDHHEILKRHFLLKSGLMDYLKTWYEGRFRIAKMFLLKHPNWWHGRGGSRISSKGVHMYKGVGVRFAVFISFFLNIPWKWNNLVSNGERVQVNPLSHSRYAIAWHQDCHLEIL